MSEMLERGLDERAKAIMADIRANPDGCFNCRTSLVDAYLGKEDTHGYGLCGPCMIRIQTIGWVLGSDMNQWLFTPKTEWAAEYLSVCTEAKAAGEAWTILVGEWWKE